MLRQAFSEQQIETRSRAITCIASAEFAGRSDWLILRPCCFKKSKILVAPFQLNMADVTCFIGPFINGKRHGNSTI